MTNTQIGQSGTESKGLKPGALGLLSSVVVGVASTAPAYSLAASLGFVVVTANGDGIIGTKAPLIMVLAFVPMYFIAVAYADLFQVTTTIMNQSGQSVTGVVMVMLTYLILSLIIGFRPDGGVLGVVAGIGLTIVFAFSVSWIWTLLGLVMRTPEAVLNLAMTVLFPLMFASNIFVNPDTMPNWLQTVVNLNPVTHLTSAVRGLMGSGAETGDLIWVFASSAILIAIFAPLTMRRYSRL